MNSTELKELVRNIVAHAKTLKDKYTTELNVPVNYACVFAQSDEEYNDLTAAVRNIGQVIQESKTGSIYRIESLDTDGGVLQILKIRLPDPTRTERGDADFTIENFEALKSIYLAQEYFSLITRPNMEMVELKVPNSSVRVYFSNPPIDRQLLNT